MEADAMRTVPGEVIGQSLEEKLTSKIHSCANTLLADQTFHEIYIYILIHIYLDSSVEALTLEFENQGRKVARLRPLGVILYLFSTKACFLRCFKDI